MTKRMCEVDRKPFEAVEDLLDGATPDQIIKRIMDLKSDYAERFPNCTVTFGVDMPATETYWITVTAAREETDEEYSLRLEREAKFKAGIKNIKAIHQQRLADEEFALYQRLKQKYEGENQ